MAEKQKLSNLTKTYIDKGYFANDPRDVFPDIFEDDRPNRNTTIYKDPRELAQNLSNIPPYNKEATVKYWEQYGDGFTDDAYESWAKEKGKQLKPRTPLNPEFAKTQLARQSYFDPEKDGTYKDQYLADDEWLQESWNDLFDEILEYKYRDVDDDYTRSYGPVDSDEKYNAYLKWKEGK